MNSIQNGFGNIEECEQTEQDISSCGLSAIDDSLSGLLNLTTMNQCIASTESYQNSGIEVPECPNTDDGIKGLDHSFPSGALFGLYSGNNSAFLTDLITNYFSDNPIGKFNVVLPRDLIYSLKQDQALINLLNNPRINIIDVETTPNVDRWMQDSFEFLTLDGKPALYQLEHQREYGSNYEERLACQIAKSCDIPYFIPPDMVDPLNKDFNSINSGGNLETLPGGTIYRGVLKTSGYRFNQASPDRTYPIVSPAQIKQRTAFEAAGNRVLDLDTSFLEVGHVDEIINIVKTNRPAPCDFAVMLASPEKAFELMEGEVGSESAPRTSPRPVSRPRNNQGSVKPTLFENIFLSKAYAGAMALNPIPREELSPADSRCAEVSYRSLKMEYADRAINQSEINDIYSRNCIDNRSVETFVNSDEYQILKRINLEEGPEGASSISQIMENNKRELLAELAQTSGCSNPPVIDVPVFFRKGLSYAPDLVNGVVHPNNSGTSTIIMPRTYFKPFDDYVENELAALGVRGTFAHDMGYHLLWGQVHCGTNTARICRQ
ncbi:MAG: protein-arginine deiminase domain-containing protein [Bacteriovoracaceae bacterium]|nr:protein-arginine deiminase domain-containing protein [Bacteriovoracaceae bacterium]